MAFNEVVRFFLDEGSDRKAAPKEPQISSRQDCDKRWRFGIAKYATMQDLSSTTADAPLDDLRPRDLAVP